MTASDFIQTPSSPMPVANRNLNVHKLKAQPSKQHDHAVATKIADLNEPSHQNHQDEPQTPRRRKRDAFFALFKPSKPEEAKPTTVGVAVPVQIPIGYTNPHHKGSLVSGKRVAYSRFMHQGRRTALAKKLECAIPEVEQVLEFPATQAQREDAEDKAALVANETKRVVARSLFF